MKCNEHALVNCSISGTFEKTCIISEGDSVRFTCTTEFRGDIQTIFCYKITAFDFH
jgi:hypothetical protein